MVRKAVVVFSVATFFISAYGATPFAVDTAHSNVGFSVPIAGGLAQVSGKFSDFKVDLNFDEKRYYKIHRRDDYQSIEYRYRHRATRRSPSDSRLFRR
jgi:polyisoprenoid-binding protein YceI